MPMLVNYQVEDFMRFHTAFQADDEDRRHNGLALLQLWRENPHSAWALFDLHDVKKAQEYLATTAAVFNGPAGVTATKSHIVETV